MKWLTQSNEHIHHHPYPHRVCNWLVHTEPPATCQLQLGILLSWHWIPCWFLLVYFCSWSCDSLYLLICLQTGDSSLPCDLHSLMVLTRTKVVDFQCSFVVRASWQLLSSLDAGTETRSPFYCRCLQHLSISNKPANTLSMLITCFPP